MYTPEPRAGFYLAIAREGEVGSGDEIKIIARDPNAVPVSEITRLYVKKGTAAQTWLRCAGCCE
jgi:MOSC domain-containing protein YiiM